MQQVNLSRVHSMIKNMGERVRALQREAVLAKGQFSMLLLKASEESDLEMFRKRVAARREALLRAKKRLELCLDYISYLKEALDAENARQGISAKLRAAAALQRKEAELEEWGRAMAPLCAQEWESEHSVDYYKSAFTDEKPMFQLTIHLFNEDYPGELKKERAALAAQRLGLEDELATLNQATVISIMSLEDFEASRG